MVSVAVIEDDDIFRENLVDYLQRQPEFTCVLAVRSVEQFLKNASTFEPIDIVLMDIGLPGVSGVDGIKPVKSIHPESDVVMITVFDDDDSIFNSLRNGAIGYLLKDTNAKHIKTLLLSISDGGSPMSPAIARKVIQYFCPPKKKPTDLLTSKEEQVVQGLNDGLSYKLIANRLSISINTVRAHVRHIYKKLHVHSKAEIIVKSNRRHGM